MLGRDLLFGEDEDEVVVLVLVVVLNGDKNKSSSVKCVSKVASTKWGQGCVHVVRSVLGSW